MDLELEITRIFAPLKPGKVILFGSRAQGEADEHSDVDLIIVYDTDKRFLDRLEECYRLWNLPLAVDILAYTKEEFSQMSGEPGFVADAVAKGRVILEAA